MTYPRLPGMYFQNVVEIIPQETEYIPLFIIQTKTAIADLDNNTTLFQTFADFKEIADEKGLTNSLKYIENALIESEGSQFYIHSIKDDSTTGFTNILKNTTHLEEIKDVIYIEETKSETSNTLLQKINAINTGLLQNEVDGIFRVGYIIPHGTIKDAEKTTENAVPEAVCINSFQTLTNQNGSGKICFFPPDSNAGSGVGKCLRTPYNEEVGYAPVTNVDTENCYNFNYTQMLALQNMGVMFIKKEKVAGGSQYRINLGVTSSFKDEKGDGLLVSRTICDQLLRDVRNGTINMVKGKPTDSNLADMDSVLSTVVDDYVTNEDVDRDNTLLEVARVDDVSFVVTGKIKTTKTLIAINVSTSLS